MNKKEELIINFLIRDFIGKLGAVLCSDGIDEFVNAYNIDIYAWLNIKYKITELYYKDLVEYTNRLKDNLKQYLEREC